MISFRTHGRRGLCLLVICICGLVILCVYRITLSSKSAFQISSTSKIADTEDPRPEDLERLLNEAAWGGLPPREELERLEAALRIAPNDPRIMAGIANGLNTLSRHDEALAVIQDAIDIREATSEISPVGFYLIKAKTLAHLHQYADAQRLFERIVESTPDLACSFHQIANIVHHAESESSNSNSKDDTAIAARFWLNTHGDGFAQKFDRLQVGMVPLEVAAIAGYPDFSFINSKKIVYWRYIPEQHNVLNFGPWIGVTGGSTPGTAFVLSFGDGKLHEMRRVTYERER